MAETSENAQKGLFSAIESVNVVATPASLPTVSNVPEGERRWTNRLSERVRRVHVSSGGPSSTARRAVGPSG